VNVDFLDPKFVRLASYLAAAGKTWRDPETNTLKTIVRGKYMSTVYPLFSEFFPDAKRAIMGEQDEKTGRSNIAFCINDYEILDMLESGGFYLGSKKRKPPVYVVTDAKLFAVYLRVLWEVHGRISSVDPLQINLEQKYPQELKELHTLFNAVKIPCHLIKTDDNYILHFSGAEDVKSFFRLLDFQADAQYGQAKLEKIAHLLK